jgi:ethanolamine ammonia-lyase large subunit
MDRDRLRQLFVLANSFKEGDLPVGGTTDDGVRADAREELLGTTVGVIRRTVLVDDLITESLERSRERRFDAALDTLTIANLRDALLGIGGVRWAHEHKEALPSEVIAALAKVMTDDELSEVARHLWHDLNVPARLPVGAASHFGSRLQPNSPGDDEHEILFSILEGLTYGCGDVILGVNPAADDLATIVRLEALLERVVDRFRLPTRYCVLSDILKQHAAKAHTRVDVGFQSLAGTSKALGGMVGLDVDGVLDLAKSFDGLYFETGQGSAVTNGAAEGVDMVTLEARAYGLARHLRREAGKRWMIVNDVAGFIGPEVFSTPAQLERTCLEDAVMGKLHGLTMGLDVCATFHMGIPPAALRALTMRVARRAAPAYMMAVGGNADPMLGYLTTSFRDHPTMRQRTGRVLTVAMQERLMSLGALDENGVPQPGADAVARLYAIYQKKGGDRRTLEALAAEGGEILKGLQARGFDLALNAAASEARLERIYTHARAALYATLDDGVLESATSDAVPVRSAASNRDAYLAQPAAGEALNPDHARLVAHVCGAESPQIQFVVSDGLNALAVNEHLRDVLPRVRRALVDRGCRVGTHDVVVRNGRVRAGYEIGALADADLVIHLIGERPGTGLNTLSAYLTYGRDPNGRPRWSRQLDHSATTAICGIHPRGKPMQVAAADIVRTVDRILEQRRSGVALKA